MNEAGEPTALPGGQLQVSARPCCVQVNKTLPCCPESPRVCGVAPGEVSLGVESTGMITSASMRGAPTTSKAALWVLYKDGCVPNNAPGDRLQYYPVLSKEPQTSGG